MAAAYWPRSITTAAAAPATPATMKLGPLQRKLSCQTFQSGWRAESAMAPATRPVLTRKCVVIAARSGCGRFATDSSAAGPPSQAKATPATWTVIASAAMLKIVQWAGYRCWTRNVHWVQAAATATTIAACGPNSMSVISTDAYDTESVDSCLAERTSLTFQIEVRQAMTSSAASASGRGYVSGNHATITYAPAPTTPAM